MSQHGLEQTHSREFIPFINHIEQSPESHILLKPDESFNHFGIVFMNQMAHSELGIDRIKTVKEGIKFNDILADLDDFGKGVLLRAMLNASIMETAEAIRRNGSVPHLVFDIKTQNGPKTLDGRPSLINLDGMPYIDLSVRDFTESIRNSANLAELTESIDSISTALWIEDFRKVKKAVDIIMHGHTIHYLRNILEEDKELVKKLAQEVRILDVNQATLDMHPGYTKEKFKQAGLVEFLGNSESAWSAFIEQVIAIAEGKISYKAKVPSQAKSSDGQEIDVRINWNVPKGHTSFYDKVVVTVENVTDLVLSGQIDERTQLNSSKVLAEQLIKETKRAIRYKSPLSYLMIDIDHFKGLNDRFGHDVGHKVLWAVAQNINRCIRDSDISGRDGGEEFGVILPNTKAKGAKIFAERIKTYAEYMLPSIIKMCIANYSMEDKTEIINYMNEIFKKYKGKKLPIKNHTSRFPGSTVSIGISSLNNRTKLEPIRLRTEADHAMYWAKDYGRNQVKNWSDEVEENWERRKRRRKKSKNGLKIVH